MGKSSKKRERTDEDVADGPSDAKPAVKKSKLDSNGKAEVTKKSSKVKETKVEPPVSEVSEPKKAKKEKKDKKEKKAKKETETKKQSESKDGDSAASESNIPTPVQDAVSKPEPEAEGPVNGVDSSDKKAKKKAKKNKKDKKAAAEDAQATTASNDENNNGNNEAAGTDGATTTTKNNSGKQARFICFVGNLPYTATADSVRAHFSTLQPTSVRLLTRRDDPAKSRGIAFVEFGSYDRMKTCLQKFHHTLFDDGKSPPRRINVELTAGGGGKTATRLEKIKQKNAKLNEERAQRMKKEEAAKQEKGPAATADDKTQEQREEEAIHPSRRGRVPYARN
ncbi:hypothetical protein VTH06DRAFT_8527 [Thermothelomyces fergusii]